MHCPSCHTLDTKVVDSRLAEEGGAIRRRRSCPECSYRFTTYERAEEIPLVVTKSDGRRQTFDRSKIVDGVQSASKGRPVTLAQIESLAEHVEEMARLEGSEVASARVGVLVLDALRELDEVVYLRFASVYKGFDGAADFGRELRLLKKLGSVAPAN
jgi:transcriptional repressor NrdR